MSITGSRTSRFFRRSPTVLMRGSSQPGTSRALHMPAKSASVVGTTMPQPSRKRMGWKPALKLDAIVPSDSSRTSLPADSAHRNDTTASAMPISRCWPPRPDGPGVEGGGDGLAGVEGADLVGPVLAQEGGRSAVGVGLVGREAAVGLDGRVVGAAVAVGPDRAVPGDRGVDDIGVDGPHGVVAEARGGRSRRGGSSGRRRRPRPPVAARWPGPPRCRGRPRCSASLGCTPGRRRSCR